MIDAFTKQHTHSQRRVVSRPLNSPELTLNLSQSRARLPGASRGCAVCVVAARVAMFAAINAGGGESDTRDSVGETTEAQCARVTTTYERALHALHAGRAAEAQGASSLWLAARFLFSDSPNKSRRASPAL